MDGYFRKSVVCGGAYHGIISIPEPGVWHSLVFFSRHATFNFQSSPCGTLSIRSDVAPYIPFSISRSTLALFDPVHQEEVEREKVKSRKKSKKLEGE